MKIVLPLLMTLSLFASEKTFEPYALSCDMDRMINGEKDFNISKSMRDFSTFAAYDVVVTPTKLYHNAFREKKQVSSFEHHDKKGYTYKGILDPQGLFFTTHIKNKKFILALGLNSTMYFTCREKKLSEEDKKLINTK